MGKWTNRILTPDGRDEQGAHIDAEDLARIAEGRVGETERAGFLRHLNRCEACYDTLQETMTAAPGGTRSRWWEKRSVYALAASLVLVVLIGGNLLYRYGGGSGGVIVATLAMDRDLRDILIEDDSLYWQDANRVNRLSVLLRGRGIRVKELTAVVVTKPYAPTKSLFGPKEILSVRVDEGIAYIEVVEERP